MEKSEFAALVAISASVLAITNYLEKVPVGPRPMLVPAPITAPPEEAQAPVALHTDVAVKPEAEFEAEESSAAAVSEIHFPREQPSRRLLDGRILSLSQIGLPFYLTGYSRFPYFDLAERNPLTDPVWQEYTVAEQNFSTKTPIWNRSVRLSSGSLFHFYL